MELHIANGDRDASIVFAALGDPTRQRIVELLADGSERRLSDLVEEFESTRQTVTRHLDVLGEAGITSTERRGRERYTTLCADAFDPAQDWLRRYDRFWDARLEKLKTLVEGGKKK